jgi:hypothetical protein
MRTPTSTGSIWRRNIDEENPPRYQCILDVLLDRQPYVEASAAVWAAVDGVAVQEALQLPFSNFEDAVTAAAARLAGCECIVTRDPKGFRGFPVRSLTPEAVIPLLKR